MRRSRSRNRGKSGAAGAGAIFFRFRFAGARAVVNQVQLKPELFFFGSGLSETGMPSTNGPTAYKKVFN